MADTGQHLQYSARNHRTRSLAIGLRWRDRVRLAQHDRHRLFQRGELLGRKGLHDCRAPAGTRAHAGMARASLAWDIQGDSAGDAAAANARLHRVRCRLLLGPADAVIRMCGAKVPQSLQVRSRTGCQQRGVATGREAGDRQALRIDMWAQHRISLHGRQCGTQVIGAQPRSEGCRAGSGSQRRCCLDDSTAITRYPARASAVPSQPHHARAAAVAMREQQGRQGDHPRPAHYPWPTGRRRTAARRVDRWSARFRGCRPVPDTRPCSAARRGALRRAQAALASVVVPWRSPATPLSRAALTLANASSIPPSTAAVMRIFNSLSVGTFFDRQPDFHAALAAVLVEPGVVALQVRRIGKAQVGRREIMIQQPEPGRADGRDVSAVPGHQVAARRDVHASPSAQARSVPCLPAVPRCSRSHHRHHCCSTRRS